MASSAVLAIRIVADASGATQGFTQASDSAGKFERGIKKATPAALATVGALGMLGKEAIDAASAVEQSTGGIESAFGPAAKSVEQFARDAAKNMGMSQSAVQEAATIYGAVLTNAGVSAEDAASSFQAVSQRAADLSAMFGGDATEALGAFQAALRGEYDSLERFGVTMTAASVQAKALEMGLVGAGEEMTAGAKAAATEALFLEQSSKAAGQFAKEADSAAGAAQIQAAETENLAAANGEDLMPAYKKVQAAIKSVTGWMADNQNTVLALAVVLGTLAVGVLAVNGAMKVWAAGQKVWTALQWAWNAAMAANPVMLVVLAVAALVAAFVILWNKSEAFRNFFIGMWEAIKTAASAVADWFTDRWNEVWEGIKTAASAALNFIYGSIIKPRIDAALAVVNGLKTGATTAWDTIKTKAKEAWDWVKDKAEPPLNAVKTTIDKIKAAITGVTDKIKGIKFPSPPSWMPGFSTPLEDMKNYDAIAQRAAAAGDPFFMTMSDGGLLGSLRNFVAAPFAAAITPRAAASTGAGMTVVNLTVQTLDARRDGPVMVDILNRELRRTGQRTLGQVFA